MRTGRHGTGVRTPDAADVADATAGFVVVVHMPNGGTFVTGVASATVAAADPAKTVGGGVVTKADGVVPKEQDNDAPATTSGCTASSIGAPP